MIEDLLGKTFELTIEPDDEPVRFQLVGYEPEDLGRRGAFMRTRCLNRVPRQQPIVASLFLAALRCGALKEV